MYSARLYVTASAGRLSNVEVVRKSPALQRHEPSSARARREGGIVRDERLGGVQVEERVFFRTKKEGWELFRIGQIAAI